MKMIKLKKIKFKNKNGGDDDKPNILEKGLDGGLSDVISAYHNYVKKKYIGKLDELIKNLEKINVTKDESDKYIIEEVEQQGSDQVLNLFTRGDIEGYIKDAKIDNKTKIERVWNDHIKYYPIEWGNGGADVFCSSYKDITVLHSGLYFNSPETDCYYKTSEIIEVLKQMSVYERQKKE